MNLIWPAVVNNLHLVQCTLEDLKWNILRGKCYQLKVKVLLQGLYSSDWEQSQDTAVLRPAGSQAHSPASQLLHLMSVPQLNSGHHCPDAPCANARGLEMTIKVNSKPFNKRGGRGKRPLHHAQLTFTRKKDTPYVRRDRASLTYLTLASISFISPQFLCSCKRDRGRDQLLQLWQQVDFVRGVIPHGLYAFVDACPCWPRVRAHRKC